MPVLGGNDAVSRVLQFHGTLVPSRVPVALCFCGGLTPFSQAGSQVSFPARSQKEPRPKHQLAFGHPGRSRPARVTANCNPIAEVHPTVQIRSVAGLHLLVDLDTEPHLDDVQVGELRAVSPNVHAPAGGVGPHPIGVLPRAEEHGGGTLGRDELD